MSDILFCPTCKTYTLNNICIRCKKKTITKKPPKFSPQDHYGEYRRKLKKRIKKEKNLTKKKNV